MNFYGCVEKELVKKQIFDNVIITKEIDAGNSYLEKAKKIFTKGDLESSTIIGYISMFHYARAYLYSCGFKERSHFCVFQYLVDNCKGELNYLGVVGQKYRIIREGLQYENNKIDKITSKNILFDSEKLKNIVVKELKTKKII